MLMIEMVRKIFRDSNVGVGNVLVMDEYILVPTPSVSL